MKLKNLLPTLVLSLAVAPELAATPVSGNQLEIDPTGTGDQVAGSIVGGVIGQNNVIDGTRTENILVVGKSNTATEGSEGFPRASLLVGESNLNQSSAWSTALGFGNILRYSGHSLAAGAMNEIDYYNWDDSKEGADGVTVLGMYNFIGGGVYASLLAGYNNHASGQDSSFLEGTITLGRGLINRYNASTIVGRYNDSTIPRNSGLVFAVGVGDGGSDGDHDRVNAVEVYSDASVSLGKVDADGLNPGAYPFSVDAEGKITMYPQGDISMGAFQ